MNDNSMQLLVESFDYLVFRRDTATSLFCFRVTPANPCSWTGLISLFSGDPRDSRALHYFNPEYPYNQYTTAIDSVGQVVQEYDSDKLFPVFGFGGVFFGNEFSSTSHCHPLVIRAENQ